MLVKMFENALSQRVVDDFCNEAAEVCLGKRGEIAGAEEFEGLDVAGLRCCQKKPEMRPILLTLAESMRYVPARTDCYADKTGAF